MVITNNSTQMSAPSTGH